MKQRVDHHPSAAGDGIAAEARHVMPPICATKTATTKDGRRLSYVEAGDPNGPLIIHNHGGPSSRYEARLLAGSAAANHLRLICVDRPGQGQSSPQTPRTYSAWADDLVAVADALGHREFGVTGWSEGGPWALAAAAYIDLERLRHVASIAGGSYGAFGDNWADEHLAGADKLGGFLALHMRPGFRLMYAALDLAASRFPDRFYKVLKKAVNPYDREILERSGFEEAFMQATAECFAHGADGLVRDAEVLYRRWSFDVETVRRPVHMWQGLDDRLVPAEINKIVSDRMPGAIWHPVADAGHFVAVGSGDEIFRVAADELDA